MSAVTNYGVSAANNVDLLEEPPRKLKQIETKVYGKDFHALLDTGAILNVLPLSFLKDLASKLS